MAQTGFTPILIYSSSTGANAPAAGNLTNSTLGSELAINITDGKLFYKDNANNVQVIAWKTTPTTAGGTGLTSYTAGDLLYYATGTTLSKLGIGAANTVLTSSGTAPQWSTSLTLTTLTATNSVLTANNSGIVGGTPPNNTLRFTDTDTTAAADQPIGRMEFYSSDTGNEGVKAYVEARATDGSPDGDLFFATQHNTGGGLFDRLRIRFDGDISVLTGNLVIGTSGKGIDFSATPGTGTSELLADYEEGTWTPVDGSGAGLTFSTAVGHYTKIGRMVTVVFNVVYPSTANASAARVGGLPFTSANTANNLSNGSFSINTSAQIAEPSILANSTNFAALVTAAGTSATNANLSLATLSGGLTYFV